MFMMSATINVEDSKKSTEEAKKVLREKNYLKMKNIDNLHSTLGSFQSQLNVSYVLNSSATMCS